MFSFRFISLFRLTFSNAAFYNYLLGFAFERCGRVLTDFGCVTNYLRLGEFLLLLVEQLAQYWGTTVV